MKSKELTTSEMFRCFRFSYKCLALKTSILHRCATVKSVSSSAARIEGAFFRWKKVHFSCKNHCQVSRFLCFGDVKTGNTTLKHGYRLFTMKCKFCNGKAPRQKIEGLSKTFEAPRLREDEDWKAYFRYLAFLEIWSKI